MSSDHRGPRSRARRAPTVCNIAATLPSSDTEVRTTLEELPTRSPHAPR